MSPDATPDPYEDPVRFGQRVQIFRTRRGMTREQLAGLMGHHSSWVKKIEGGQLRMPRLPEILRFAEVLRVRTLNDLVGGDNAPEVDLFVGPGHPKLPAVARVINAYPLDSDRAAPGPEYLRARLATAWAARHKAPNHREVLGNLLPGLIQDAQLAVRQSETVPARRAAQAVLSEVYSLSQFFVAYQPDSALLWRVAERGMVAAQESEDPHAIGVAAWLAVQAHRDSGPAHFDAADDLTLTTLRYLSALLPDAPDNVRAIAGALQFEAGYTAARRAESGSAWGWWDKAMRSARALPADYYHPVTSFGQAIMGAHAVTVAVELRAGGESVRQAERAGADTIPSRPRRARHRIEQARAYHLDGQHDTALATLELAHAAAPETIRYNGYARRLILEEAACRTPERRRRAAELAVKIGMLAA
ncbi:XRE family transcriptional regulator [Streptomyces sp. SDr-06]|uniref:helix-turn-helix domain-containing protein n=1 Tax=Streptomyces sp. SDr-06 TaxID=2267702 RepID=UPI000DEAA245|nr:helix-turn-helix transcriptional regulator [Streptomyces sp. SDr-06]RCH67835.1 XRE family transcriptional regulator [Streptomyces sp. SDr-06]